MNIAIIDYGAGNVQSVLFALQRLGYQGILTRDTDTIESADKVIFPGVGAAGSAMQKLSQAGLDKLIPRLTQPVLGICLGMQLMCRETAENNTQGLGIFDIDVIKFPNTIKVPHVGWNTLHNVKSLLFESIAENEYMYMVHSYYAPICNSTIALTKYGTAYSSALQNGNFYGVQFHPEKSGTAGERLLSNFIKLTLI